jgi:hypothetical protein
VDIEGVAVYGKFGEQGHFHTETQRHGEQIKRFIAELAENGRGVRREKLLTAKFAKENRKGAQRKVWGRKDPSANSSSTFAIQDFHGSGISWGLINTDQKPAAEPLTFG